MVRFAEKMLDVQVEYINNKRSINKFCVGGQTIQQLLRTVQNNVTEIGRNVICMIGTNNFLKGDKINYMLKLMRLLVEELVQNDVKIILLTVPPVPKLLKVDKDHLTKLWEFNNALFRFDDGRNVKVLDIAPLFLTDDKYSVKENLFEKEIYFKGNVREDLIHLNKYGLLVLKNRLSEFLTQGNSCSGESIDFCRGESAVKFLERKERAGKPVVSHPGVCLSTKIRERSVTDTRVKGEVLLGDPETKNELLNESNYNKGNIKSIFESCPEVELDIYGKKVRGIVDSGSQATIISKSLFDELIKLNPQILTLPVSNLAIMGATGVKSKRIHLQALLDLKYGDKVIQATCFVIDSVNIDFLLGNDFFRQYKAKVCWENNYLELSSDGDSRVTIPFVEVNETSDKSKSYLGKIRVIEVGFLNMMSEGNDFDYTVIHVMGVLGKGKKVNRSVQTERVLTDENHLSVNLCKVNEREQTILQLNDICELTREQYKENKEIQVSKLHEVLIKNAEVFSDKPGCMKNTEIKLTLKDDKVFLRKPYAVPYSKRKSVEAELQRMKEMGIIEESHSPYSNPLVCVVKKDLSVRLCLDCRGLNQNIVNDCQRTERVDDILQKFTGVKYLTSLDLTSGFLQLPLHVDSRKYVAFTFNGKNFQFRRLPFGTSVSTAHFIKAVDKMLGPEFNDFVTTYVDDILITSKSFEEHLEHIDRVLTRMREWGVTVKLSKSQFLKQEVKFLGYVISCEGITPDPDKVKKIVEFKEPRNVKQLQSFLGLCNFYRKFKSRYSDLTAGFSHILSSKSKWNWTDREAKLFNEVKKSFLECVMLKHPDFSKTFYLNCDASSIAISSVLYQLDEEGNEQVISFASRQLLPTERHYSICELELLAVVFACTKFRTYLIGHHRVVVRSDHKALSFFKSCKLSHGRLLRWSLVLQEYCLEIEYVPGKMNVVADVLSRMDYGEGNVEGHDINTIQAYVSQVTFGAKDSELRSIFKSIRQKQRNDPRIGPIINSLENEDELSNKFKEVFKIHNNVLFKRRSVNDHNWCICIPEVMESQLIQFTHLKFGHLGGYKIYSILKEYCVFPRMEKTVKKQVSKCDLCQKAKHSNIKQVGFLQPIISDHLNDLVCVDLIGELPTSVGGAKYIFSLVEMYSKYVKLYAIKKANTKTLINKIVNDYLPTVGEVKCILSDHGTQFTSNEWYEVLQSRNIRVVHSSCYHPQSNPVERVNKEIGKICRMLCHEKHTKWALCLKFIEDCLNHSVHDSTGHIPYEIMFGRPSNYFLNHIVTFPRERKFDYNQKVIAVHQRLTYKAEKRKEKYDKKLKGVKYNIGDKVLVKTHYQSDKLNKKIKKFFLLFQGPYEIIECKMENSYVVKRLDNDEIVGTFNVTELKKYVE